MHDPLEPVRIDKWLWAARLAKTRPLAAEAVRGGHVEVNGRRVPPGRKVAVGDRLELAIGELPRTVIVRATAERRGPASVAAQLYEETPESRTERERLAEERRLAGPRASSPAAARARRSATAAVSTPRATGAASRGRYGAAGQPRRPPVSPRTIASALWRSIAR